MKICCPGLSSVMYNNVLQASSDMWEYVSSSQRRTVKDDKGQKELFKY